MNSLVEYILSNFKFMACITTYKIIFALKNHQLNVFDNHCILKQVIQNVPLVFLPNITLFGCCDGTGDSYFLIFQIQSHNYTIWRL